MVLLFLRLVVYIQSKLMIGARKLGLLVGIIMNWFVARVTLCLEC